MSEEEKKAMDELIKFSKKWTKKFNEEKLIFSGQEIKDIVGLSERIYGGIYKEDNIDYDPDSSPFAWNYYHTMYSELISWTDNENKTDKKYYRREGIRKIAVFSLEVNHTLQQIKYQEYSEENDTSSLKYGGDCAFNFNNLKYARFLKLVNNKDLYNKLNFCAMMHHSPLNFALMPRTGNLNNAKGTGDDRLDIFLFRLNEFYEVVNKKTNQESNLMVLKRISKTILSKSTLGNFPSILEFLLDVQGNEVEKISNTTKETKEIQVGTRNYVKLFYPWVNDKLLESLVKNGQHPITSAKELNTYMNLAIKYWTAVSEYYNALI